MNFPLFSSFLFIFTWSSPWFLTSKDFLFTLVYYLLSSFSSEICWLQTSPLLSPLSFIHLPWNFYFIVQLLLLIPIRIKLSLSLSSTILKSVSPSALSTSIVTFHYTQLDYTRKTHVIYLVLYIHYHLLILISNKLKF